MYIKKTKYDFRHYASFFNKDNVLSTKPFNYYYVKF